MNIVLSSANVKILTKDDVVELKNTKCLSNENFNFQVYIESATPCEYEVEVQSDLPVHIYEVINKVGRYDMNKNDDEFYIRSDDDLYPELLLPTNKISFSKEGSKTLFFNIDENEKKFGEHLITVKIGEEETSFVLSVLSESLQATDLINTNWFHLDGICNYYNVKPFSQAFYKHFEHYLAAYARMGNTMLLIPMFTPALDTEINGERLTTQLVGIRKNGEEYEFDFSEAKKYIRLAKSYGIKYFELSHLFTQWGGECCPKIVAFDGKEEIKIFGWETKSDDLKYLSFLKSYFIKLNDFLIAEGIKENTYMHLTDEPHAEHIEKYTKLMDFVRMNNFGVKTMDALSHYAFVEKTKIDLPAVSTSSEELDLFKNVKKLLYYCVWTDHNYLSNRYFFMPLLRTEILGMQLYKENVAGFLHWGYNFYNTFLSKASLNPYDDATAGGEFVSGDSFIVYPADNGVNYSIRYFAMLKAFEDYRLLKTLENKIGRAAVEKLLEKYGLKNLHEYPREVEKYELLRDECYSYLI